MARMAYSICKHLLISVVALWRRLKFRLRHASLTIHCSALVPFALLAYIAYFCRRLCSLFFTYTLSLRSPVK